MLFLCGLLVTIVSLNNIVYACDKDPHQGVLVVAAGSFLSASNEQGINWSPSEIKGQMTFNSVTCRYEKAVDKLPTNTNYEWKVAFNGNWGGDKGCNGGANCQFNSGSTGAVLLIYNPFSGQLTGTSTSSSQTTSPGGSTSAPSTCFNSYNERIVRASGDYQTELGSTAPWLPTEENSLMTFDDTSCLYLLILSGLTPSKFYEWKVTFDNSWSGSIGCGNGGNCKFSTSTAGTVELIFEPSSKQLSFRHLVTVCGNSQCELGETCRTCLIDCGQCPPAVCGDSKCEDAESCETCSSDCGKCPICGDGICQTSETYQTCPQDCSNELSGCGIFKEESCVDDSQFHAIAGVEEKRWQTPKPGMNGYQSSFQDYHTLVGYADIIYTDTNRLAADVCLQIKHRQSHSVTLTYFFDGIAQTTKCKHYTSAYTGILSAIIAGSDGSTLELPEIDFIWNAKPIFSRSGDYRNGQKGAIAEMFGWPHKDVKEECEFLGKAGYLGVKLFPVHEQLMSTQPFENAMNPWYFMYQPVSYNLDGRMGTREELRDLIQTCRNYGVRVYIDAVLNHFTGAGNDLNQHRNPGSGCVKWGNKTSSAPIERQSPFYTHAFTYQYNPNTGKAPSNEFPAAAIGPEDFHCDRPNGAWTNLFILNNGWLVGLVDLDTSKDYVRERQAAYLVDMLSLGASGFRIDAAKHISPEDLSAIMKKVQIKMGGKLPDDFFVWLEVLTGGEAQYIWTGPSWYGTMFTNILKQDLILDSEVDKIKMWDGLYPKEPFHNPTIPRHRVVIQNDDHDQQNPGSSSRDMDTFGCVLVKNCSVSVHRNFEIRLFTNPNGVTDNDNDWPIRFLLSSYYHTYGDLGIPDGKSSCDLCTVMCETCRKSVPYIKAHEPMACSYVGNGYTRTHRDIPVINAMRAWMKLTPISGASLGIGHCT
ncbi:unnamed protein product [Rotaria sp. Silwood1]|nr:unnamed protein product [Rotaria sp. Silwood1]CAF1398375.1 unnamed protein product [Rotaria sp. Silwood1]CAF3499754.1 unnamed protein product [Rotaria sp. Silwood1]CAF3563511.1 unnamed protein product [Rotaria sp. Silwood1]CAF3585644.1 unnamed protein product [Rotaria sp. Silwood1]